MSGLYSGYINLVLIAFGALAYFVLTKLSDSSVMHPKITIEETNMPTIVRPTADHSTVSDMGRIFTKLYENSVLYGGFNIPKVKRLGDFRMINNFVLPSDTLGYINDYSSIRHLNLVLPNLNFARMLGDMFGSYGASNSKLLLMHKLGYIGVVEC